jgi:hypothetical protein
MRLAINGRVVGRAALTPGWTNYRRRVLYDTHDVTALLRAGDNVLALMLGNGMYNVEAKEGRYTKFLDSFGRPKAILAMTIEHADGQVEHLPVTGNGAGTRADPLFLDLWRGRLGRAPGAARLDGAGLR